MASIRRGDVWLVNFDPTMGAEVRKRRPAVVVSNDLNNELAPLVTVVPLSTNVSRIYPFEVRIPRETGMRKVSKAMANQIRTVSKKRVLRKLGLLPAEIMTAVEGAILLHLAIER
jgi:mRNA interferase MazF